MAQWVEMFWANGLLDGVDPLVGASSGDGQARCDNPGFLGSYAATGREDFAETFSAFVFQFDVADDALQAKFDWMAEQPGLVEFRDRAIAAGLGPLENNVELCGGT